MFNGASAAPISQVHTLAMWILLVTISWTVPRWGGIQWHNVHTEFHEDQLVSTVLMFIVEFGDGQSPAPCYQGSEQGTTALVDKDWPYPMGPTEYRTFSFNSRQIQSQTA